MSLLNLERAQSHRMVRWPSLVGLVLIPLIIAGGFVYAVWNSTDRLDRVQAAVVNNDEPIKVNGQLVPLGRQLSAGLVDGGASSGGTGSGKAKDLPKDQNFTWVLSDDADAKSGVESGRYAAVVTIPKNFSKAATSYSGDASKAEQATLDIRTSQVTGIADSALSSAIASAATTAMNQQLTQTYLDNIYVGFNDLGSQFATVGDAAGQLADGAKSLADGAGQTDKGTKALSTGLGQLGTGADQLSTGVTGVSTGAAQLSAGLGKLAAGTAELPAQSKQLAAGADQIADGAKKYADGVKSFARGVEGGKGEPGLAAGAEGLAKGAAGLGSGLAQYQKSVAGLDAKAIGNPFTCPLPEGTADRAALCDSMAKVFDAGVQAGGQAAAAGLDAKDPTSGLSLKQGVAQLGTGAQQLSGGIGQLVAGVKGTDSQPGLADGAASLADGASAYAAGVKKLADGMPALSKGIAASADGASGLADGAKKLASGASQLATGVSASADGAAQLAAGTGKLADGAGTLSDGTGKLADGIKDGAKKVPSFSKDDRSNLATVVSQPVKQESAASASGGDGGAAIFADVSAASFLIVIALWIGALVTYLVVRAVSRRALTSMAPSWRLSLAGLLPGAIVAIVQAALLTVLALSILHLSGREAAGMGFFAALAGVTFVAVNHALVALFGGYGRFVSVILVVLTAAGGIVSAVPQFFDAVKPFLPLTPALDGLRAIATGSPGAGAAAGSLLGWLLIAVVAGILAVARRRQTTPARLARLQAASAG